MTKINHPNYYEWNRSFNAVAEKPVGDLFQTGTVEPLGYVNRPAYNPNRKGIAADGSGQTTVEHITVVPTGPIPLHERFNTGTLGAYERLVLACLAWGQYATYVVAGEMGSGKSSMMRHIASVLRTPRRTCGTNCKSCTPLVATIDFDGGVRYTTAKDILPVFLADLYDALCGYFRQVLLAEDAIDRFVAFAAAHADQSHYGRFGALLRRTRRVATPEMPAWAMLRPEEKADTLFEYISEFQSAGERIDAAMAIARFIREEIRRDGPCFVMLFDNIDRHPPDQQLEVLLATFGLQQTANVRVIIAMRNTTFARLRSDAAFAFGYITHEGPRPMEIARRRCVVALQKWKTNHLVQALEPAEAEALRRRVAEACELLGTPSPYRRQIESIAGDSVRLGLTLCERIIVNATVRFDEPPLHKQDLVRAILLEDSVDQQLATDDRYVANIFADPVHNTFTLLPLYILQLVHGFRHVRRGRRFVALWRILTGMGSWDEDTVRETVNYLLSPTRPLLWVDSKYEYTTFAHMTNANDVFHLTEAGRRYLTTLARSSVYLSEALFAVGWTSPEAPRNVDCGSIAGRSVAIRKMLRIAFEDDLAHYARLKEFLAHNPHLAALRFEPTTVRIIMEAAQWQQRTLGLAATAVAQQEYAEWCAFLFHCVDKIALSGEPVQPRLTKLAVTFNDLMIDPSNVRRPTHIQRSGAGAD